MPLENKIHIFAPPCNILYVHDRISLGIGFNKNFYNRPKTIGNYGKNKHTIILYAHTREDKCVEVEQSAKTSMPIWAS